MCNKPSVLAIVIIDRLRDLNREGEQIIYFHYLLSVCMYVE